ncbi:MAG: hypothetical protein N4A50_10505 [Vallitalea sp.]|jgi:hypothetical protein|nr:hypothetical protein [Vallitalea sp.]
MNTLRYLYIDDEDVESLNAIIDGFNDIESIVVELFPLDTTKSFDELKANLLDRLGEFDGLILDLRLDGEGPNRVGFSAPTIAQDLRTLSARKEIKSFPIVLCSTEPKIKETYNADKSSHNLFDYKFEKSEEIDYVKFSRKLKSLAFWYKWFDNQDKNINEVFARQDLNGIDSRIYDRFLNTDTTPLPTDYSKFIINNLFHHPGALIKERTLAARLGIDIEKSSDWARLRDEVLTCCKYEGLFNDGWKRWWADKLILFFKEISDNASLSYLNAEQRVKILQEKTSLTNLVPATPIKYCVSTEFWTICEGYKKPLDPLEGFIVYEKDEIKPWQESKYISFDAVIERVGQEKGLKPHPSEVDNISEFKESL